MLRFVYGGIRAAGELARVWNITWGLSQNRERFGEQPDCRENRLSGRRYFSGFLLVIKEVPTEWDGACPDYNFDACRKVIAEEFEAFRAGYPSMPEQYEGLILGEKLPREYREKTIVSLKAEGFFQPVRFC